MTSNVIWPDQLIGEEAVKGKINQVVIYLVTHDKIIIESQGLWTQVSKAITVVHIWYTSTCTCIWLE